MHARLQHAAGHALKRLWSTKTTLHVQFPAEPYLENVSVMNCQPLSQGEVRDKARHDKAKVCELRVHLYSIGMGLGCWR